MTTLVTGATGFLGSRVARRLIEDGEPVRMLVRATSDRRRLRGLEVDERLGDVTDRASLDRAVAGCDRVVHCAGVYELGTRDWDAMRRVNVDGTRHVLEAAAAGGAAAVHVSSTIALGPTGTEPAGEDHWAPGPGVSAYYFTKREGHETARRLMKEGADIRIVSPTTIYGPDDPSMVGRLHAFASRFPVPLTVFADMGMTFVHVDDCADAIARALEAPAGAEFIAGAENATFQEWFEAIARAAGRRHRVAAVPDATIRRLAPVLRRVSRLAEEGLALSHGNHWTFSGDKARRELGWDPRSLDAGLGETIAWYRGRRPSKASTTSKRGVRFGFVEVMSGTVQLEGERFDRPFRFEFDVTDGRLGDYFRDTATGQAVGRVTIDGFASDVPAEGFLELSPYKHRTIRYVFDFTADDGKPYGFDGHKTIVHSRMVSSWTTLPGHVFDGEGKVIGDALLRFDLRNDGLDLARSFTFSRG